MIAIAIACLLGATIVLAALSAADSLLRGWSAYGALAAELRAVRAANASGSPVHRPRAPTLRPARLAARSCAPVPARSRIAA